MVYIVGAGPGDPELITVKGLACLRKSDVIIHDRLVHRSLLEQACPGAEVIDVGKQPGKSHQIQQWINTLLIAKARFGHTVCRLKGGDPFVFGRGGEEVQVLATAGIPFEIVSGVSSVTAAAAAAGIPLTHRDHAHGFMVITACHTAAAPEDWTIAAKFVRGGGTLVVLMGLARLGQIASALQIFGCAGATPAAVIASGTLPSQEVRFASLREIAAKAADLKSPAIIVIGSVVGANFKELQTSDKHVVADFSSRFGLMDERGLKPATTCLPGRVPI
jgi:uroporphyrin-III C-methyltransferase